MFNRRATDQHQEFLNQAMPHTDAMYRTAVRMLGDQRLAEDIVQEALMRAFAHYASFEQGTNFKAWIFKILTNLVRNHYRKQAGGPSFVEWDSVEGFKGETVEDLLRAEEAGQIDFEEVLDGEIRASLDRLPPEYREVVMLALVEDFSYQDISRMLDIPLGTVMSRLFRGRQLLRRDLTEYARKMGYVKHAKDGEQS